jgi:hypothetical protein
MTLSLRDVVRKRYGITGNFSFINAVLSRAKHDVSESVYRTANGVSLQRLLAFLDRPPSPPPPPPKPIPIPPPKLSISVSTEGSGATSVFVITGSGFLPNHVVHVRVVDDTLSTLFFQQSSDGSGQFKLRQSIQCITGLALHFSANDERSDPHDVTGTLWSNTFTTSCP